MWRKVIITLVVVLFAYTAFSVISLSVQERPYKWDYSFKEYSKQPYGTKVFHSQLERFFPNQLIEKVPKEQFYNYFEYIVGIDSLDIDALFDYQAYDTEDSIEDFIYPHNFLSISRHFYGTHYAINSLVSHAAQGGNAQIYAFDFNPFLLERLGLTLNGNSIISIPRSREIDSIYTSTGEHFTIRKATESNFFETYSRYSEVLIKNEDGEALGVKVPIGFGSISVFVVPHLFTNYDLLNYDRGLAEHLLNQLPIEDTYWSVDLNYYGNEKKKSLLSFVHSYSTLTWAYYLLIFSALAFLLFQIQRKQRIIPVVSPPENLSLSFLRTISDLHQSKKDHRSMLQKKMNFMLTNIQARYHLSTTDINDYFIEQLVKRSNKKEKEVVKLFKYYHKLMKSDHIDDKEFTEMCRLFQLFKK